MNIYTYRPTGAASTPESYFVGTWSMGQSVDGTTNISGSGQQTVQVQNDNGLGSHPEVRGTTYTNSTSAANHTTQISSSGALGTTVHHQTFHSHATGVTENRNPASGVNVTRTVTNSRTTTYSTNGTTSSGVEILGWSTISSQTTNYNVDNTATSTTGDTNKRTTARLDTGSSVNVDQTVDMERNGSHLTFGSTQTETKTTSHSSQPSTGSTYIPSTFPSTFGSSTTSPFIISSGAVTVTTTASSSYQRKRVTTARSFPLTSTSWTSNYVTSTSNSYTITSGTSTLTSSSWDLVTVRSNMATSLTVTTNTLSANVESYVATTTTGTTGGSVLGHHFFPEVGASIFLNEYQFKTRSGGVWLVRSNALGVGETEVGELTKFFSRANQTSLTVDDLGKYSTDSHILTLITVQISSGTTTRSTASGTGASGSITATTAVYTKNGDPWVASDSSVNIATTTVTYDVGDVGTSLRTSTIPGTLLSFTDVTHELPISGYDSVWSFTTGTTKAEWFGGVGSYTQTYLTLHSPVTTRRTGYSRETMADTILVGSYSTVQLTDTIYYPEVSTYTFSMNVELGLYSTTTSQVFTKSFTYSADVWDTLFNREVFQYESRDEDINTFSGGGASYTQVQKINQEINATYFSHKKLYPAFRPITEGVARAAPANLVWYTAPPNGYVGFGGTFNINSIDVFMNVKIDLINGSAYPGQTVGTNNFLWAEIYPGITFFPMETNLPLYVEGAQSARFSKYGTAAAGEPGYLLVTWTAVSTSGSTTTRVSRLATYRMSVEMPVEGSFIRTAPLDFNTRDVKYATGNIYPFEYRGGYGGGHFGFTGSYTAWFTAQIVSWTSYANGSSLGSGVSSDTKSHLSFAVPNSAGIVFDCGQLLMGEWIETDLGHQYQATYSHVGAGLNENL